LELDNAVPRSALCGRVGWILFSLRRFTLFSEPKLYGVFFLRSENGGAVGGLVGAQLSDWFAIQGNYIWNSHELTLSSAEFINAAQQGYQETRRSSQQSIIGDPLVYFRNRDSRFRPYIAVGTGLVHFSSSG
jgi:hypothetical protein